MYIWLNDSQIQWFPIYIHTIDKNQIDSWNSKHKSLNNNLYWLVLWLFILNIGPVSIPVNDEIMKITNN